MLDWELIAQMLQVVIVVLVPLLIKYLRKARKLERFYRTLDFLINKLDALSEAVEDMDELLTLLETSLKDSEISPEEAQEILISLKKLIDAVEKVKNK